LIVAFDVAASL